MVPDSDVPESDPSDATATGDARTDIDASPAPLDDLQDSDAYDLVYRATRDALWDVLGTATLILFYIALGGIGLSIAVGGIGPFLRGSATVSALAVGLAGLAVAVFAAVRVYRLVTE
jgi:hypothetical protein